MKPRLRKLRIIFVVLLIVLLVFGAFNYLTSRGQEQKTSESGETAEPVKKRPDNTIRLVATGDMIGHDSITQNAKNSDGSYDYASLMIGAKKYFQDSDISFCNEATMAAGEKHGITGYPSFNAPIEFARGLEDVGCNVINLGTNHTNDKGQAMIDDAVTVWDNRPGVLAVAGANRSLDEQKKPRIFTVKGMKFALLSYLTYTNQPVANGYGVNMYDEATAKVEIATAQSEADFVIVSMRWGTEYSHDINDSQDRIAKVLADAGADVIFGHGTHTLQPVKRVLAADGREALAWFSLGNFLNSQTEIENLIGGFAVMDIDTSTKKITNISFLPMYQHYEWTATQKARANTTDLAARHNFQMMPLDEAGELLEKSVHETTVEAQTERVRQLLNTYTEVPVISSGQY